MTSWRSVLGALFICILVLATAGCEGTTGVGIGVASPGGHWGGGSGPGPGVWVGGPTYR